MGYPTKNDKGLTTGKSILWNSAGSLIYIGCNWMTTILVVLIYPTYEASGMLAAAMAVGNIVATIVLFKVRAFQVSDVAHEFKSSDYVSLRIVCSVFGAAFSIAYSVATTSPNAFVVAIAYSAFKVIDSFVDVFHGIDQVHNRLDIAGLSQILRGILLLICFTLSSILTHDLAVSVASMAISSLAIVVFYDFPSSNKLERISVDWNPRALKKLALACLPGFTSSIFATLVVSISRQLFGVWFGDNLLGIYAAIATPAVIVQAMASYVYAPLLGPIAIAYLHDNKKEILRLINRFLACLAAITLCALCFFYLCAEPFFQAIFGSEIASYSYLIFPVIACTSLTAAELFVLDILIVFRNYIGAIASSFSSFVLSLPLSYPLFSIYGMNGISFTIILAYLAGIITSLPFIFRSLSSSSQK